jgi:hypothetical protein
MVAWLNGDDNSAPPPPDHRSSWLEVHLLYEAGNVIPSVGNLIEEKSCVNTLSFPPACENRKYAEGKMGHLHI